LKGYGGRLEGEFLKLENYRRGRDYRSSSVLAFSRTGQRWSSNEGIDRRGRDAVGAGSVPATLCSKSVLTRSQMLATRTEETMRRFMVHLATVRPIVKPLRDQGLSLRAIVEILELRAVPTARGGRWAVPGRGRPQARRSVSMKP
jgi:hypothetical protein